MLVRLPIARLRLRCRSGCRSVTASDKSAHSAALVKNELETDGARTDWRPPESLTTTACADNELNNASTKNGMLSLAICTSS